MRIELRDGQWAELREHPSHGQVNIVRRALLRAGEDLEAAVDVALAYVSAYVIAWSVHNGEGDVPLSSAVDAPDDIVQAIAAAAQGLYAGRPDPKDSAGPSDS